MGNDKITDYGEAICSVPRAVIRGASKMAMGFRGIKGLNPRNILDRIIGKYSRVDICDSLDDIADIVAFGIGFNFIIETILEVYDLLNTLKSVKFFSAFKLIFEVLANTAVYGITYFLMIGALVYIGSRSNTKKTKLPSGLYKALVLILLVFTAGNIVVFCGDIYSLLLTGGMYYWTIQIAHTINLLIWMSSLVIVLNLPTYTTVIDSVEVEKPEKSVDEPGKGSNIDYESWMTDE